MRFALAVFLFASSAAAQQEDFIAKNGGDAQVAALKGPERTQRVREIQLAYEQLASKHHATFAYAKAAEVYEQFANHAYLDTAVRRDAARNAMMLYGAMEKRDKIVATQKTYFQLAPSAIEKTQAEYFLADFDARHVLPQAKAELASFHAAHRLDKDAARYALEAIWRLAKLHPAASAEARDAFKKTVTAWEFLKAVSPDDAKRSPWVDYAAEAEYVLLDQEIRDTFDYGTGHLRYGTMTPAKIAGRYGEDAKRADQLDRALQHIIDTYESSISTLALTRQGTIYESLYTGLNDIVALRAEKSAAENLMVRRYADAAARGQARFARTRLAFYAITLGDAKLRQYVSPKVTYRDGMYRFPPPLPVTAKMSLDVMPAPP